MFCINCNKEIKNRNKYCSIKCQKEYEYKTFIDKWKKGGDDGMRGEYQISMHIKTYLLKKYESKCARCGWGEIELSNNQEQDLLDVYTDDNQTRIGLAERGVVHYFNLWHREVACWIVNDKNEILLQRRSANKKQQPNMLAVTAGHIDLNETPIQALLREVSEELGLNNVREKDFIYLDTFKAENKNNHHYKYVYLLKTNKKLEQLTMQKSEVSELLYLSLDKLRKMMALPNTELTFAKHFYTPIILSKIEELL